MFLLIMQSTTYFIFGYVSKNISLLIVTGGRGGRNPIHMKVES